MRKVLVPLFALPFFAMWVFPTQAPPPGSTQAIRHQLTDAVIRYENLGGGDDFLVICRDWAPRGGGCADDSERGILYAGEDSLSKYGWADTDGYYHPRPGCTTEASTGAWVEVSHAAPRPGWVKTFGSNGAAWTVRMRCG